MDAPLARGLRATAPVTLCFLLFACASNPATDSPSRGIGDPVALDPAPLPAYRQGDLAVYSDGVWERVTAVSGEQVEWARGGGTSYTAWRSVFLPSSSWREDEATYTQLIDVAPDSLWPLSVGAELVYAVASGEPGGRAVTVRSRRCAVSRSVRVRVAAGDFDTFEIACHEERSGGRTRPYRTWYYAPALGHYVLRLDYRRGQFWRRHELVAFSSAGGLGPDAALALDAALQAALERTPSGRTARIEDERFSAIHTTPSQTLRMPAGTYCRTFEQRFSVRGERRRSAGIACRDPKGVWRIPGAP